MRYCLLISVVGMLILVGCRSHQSVSADEHIKRGNFLHDRGDLEGAIAEFDRAIAINPNQPFYHFNRGNARKDKREFDFAISDYNKAISIDANIPDVYDNRGVARMSKGDLDGAVSDFNIAITINPNQTSTPTTIVAMFDSKKVTMIAHLPISKRRLPSIRMTRTFTTIAAACVE